MIIEPINIHDEHFLLSEQIYKEVKDGHFFEKGKLVIGICGESGSGKTVTSVCLQQYLERCRIHSMVLHLDSYYKLPPTENHLKRKQDIGWVGPNELNLDLIEAHIVQFKANHQSIMVPVVDYQANAFLEVERNLEGISVLIIEGVYAFHVQHIDYGIFLEKNYRDTLEDRKKRTREVYDEFVEQVLEIEHHLVTSQKGKANMIIDKDYHIVK